MGDGWHHTIYQIHIFGNYHSSYLFVLICIERLSSLSSSQSESLLQLSQGNRNTSFYDMLSFPSQRIIRNLYCFFHWLYRRLNLQYHPFEALKSASLLRCLAYALMSFSVSRIFWSIFVQRVIYISPSVGRPPSSFLSHPFFFQRSRFLRGMPYFSDISLASTPSRI